MTRHVVIVGAGIIGVMCAIESLRAGLRVTVVEPGTVGGDQAASYGNAGWLSSHSIIPPSSPGIWKKVPGYLMDPLGPLAIRPTYLIHIIPWLRRFITATDTQKKMEDIGTALRTLLLDAPQLHQRVASEAGLSHLIKADSGVLHVYRSRREFELDSLAWNIRRQCGISWLELTNHELHTRQPLLSPDYKFGVWVAEAGHCINPGAYVAGLAKQAIACGANFVSAKAIGFELDNHRLKAVLLENGRIPCDAAVISAGAHSKKLAQSVGNDVLLETERGYHVFVQGSDFPQIAPMLMSDQKLNVTLMEEGLRISGQVELAGMQAAPDWCRADVLKNHLYQFFPDLLRYPPERFRYWMGHRPSSPDGKPYIGYANATSDVILAFGHGHIGLVTSAKTGRIVAQLLTGTEPEISIKPFSPQRT